MSKFLRVSAGIAGDFLISHNRYTIDNVVCYFVRYVEIGCACLRGGHAQACAGAAEH